PFSTKIAWPKLASITDHAGARRFWRRGDLQRDVDAQRSVCGRLLAETSELGGRRCLRVHGDQFGSLSVDSLARPADVLGLHCGSSPVCHCGTWFASFSSQSRSSRLPLISALNRTSNSGSPPLPIPTSTSRVRRGRLTSR